MSNSKKAKEWLQLLLGFGAIFFFIAVAAPFLSNLPLAREAVENIEEKQIDPRALFYTESPEAVEAGRILNERMKE